MSYDDIRFMKVNWNYLIGFSLASIVIGGEYALLRYLITFGIGYIFFQKGFWGGADIFAVAIISAYTPVIVFGRFLMALGVVSTYLMLYMKIKKKQNIAFIPAITFCYILTILIQNIN